MTIKPFRVRWMRHLADLHSKVHHSPKLQEHFNSFGAKDLTFEIVKSWNCKNSETIKMAEQNEKDIWSLYSDVCFNSFEPRGGFTSKKEVFDESREIINKLAKNPKISIKEAAKEIGVGYGTLQKFIKNEKINWISNRDKQYILSVLINNRIRIEEMGLEYYSITEAAQEIGVKPGAMRDYIFSENISWPGWGYEKSVRCCFSQIEAIRRWAKDPSISIIEASVNLGVSYPTLKKFSESQNIVWDKK